MNCKLWHKFEVKVWFVLSGSQHVLDWPWLYVSEIPYVSLCTASQTITRSHHKARTSLFTYCWAQRWVGVGNLIGSEVYLFKSTSFDKIPVFSNTHWVMAMAKTWGIFQTKSSWYPGYLLQSLVGKHIRGKWISETWKAIYKNKWPEEGRFSSIVYLWKFTTLRCKNSPWTATSCPSLLSILGQFWHCL